jgi:hypothetical protein
MNEATAEAAAATVRDQIEYGIQVLNAVTACADELGRNADRDNPTQVASILLHVTMIELFAGCSVLAQRAYTAGIPILLRSMYEALVDLDNLTHINGYHEHFEAAGLKQLIKVGKSQAVAKHFEERQRQHLAEFAARFEELKAKAKTGKKQVVLSIEERCKLADRTAQYESLYGFFCLDAHNNASALGDRHLSDDEAHGMTIDILGKPDMPSLVSRLSFGAHFLIESGQFVHGAFRTESKARMDALADAHEKRRLSLKGSRDSNKLV